MFMNSLFKVLVVFIVIFAVFILLLTLIGMDFYFDIFSLLFYAFIILVLICLIYSTVVIIGNKNNKNKIIGVVLFIFSLIFIYNLFMFYAEGATGVGAIDGKIKAYLDGMRVVAEEYRLKNKSYIGFENTENSINFKESINPRLKNSSILFSSEEKYCMQEELHYRNKIAWFREVPIYFCVDSTGYIGSMSGCDPINYDCAK
jgi:hypothetical protein